MIGFVISAESAGNSVSMKREVEVWNVKTFLKVFCQMTFRF